MQRKTVFISGWEDVSLSQILFGIITVDYESTHRGTHWDQTINKKIYLWIFVCFHCLKGTKFGYRWLLTPVCECD